MSGTGWTRRRSSFHQRVRDGYLKLVEQEPERWVVVNAARSVEEVQAEIRGLVRGRLGQVKRNA